MTGTTEAWAGLVEDIGAALQTFGGRLREAASAAAPAADAGRQPPDTVAEEGLGSSQLRVLAAVREVGDRGTTSHALAKATGIADSNTPRILKALSERGLVWAGDVKPTIWTAAR